jgi:hypothetical protein
MAHDKYIEHPAVEPSILNGPFPSEILYLPTQYEVARPDSLSCLGKEDLAMFVPGV